MTPRGRMMALINGKEYDKVPFYSFTELMPTGEFERELRNKGMVLVTHCNSVWSEIKNVSIESASDDGVLTTIYHTPVGKISTKHRINLGRVDGAGRVQVKHLIENVRDYEPAIFIVENTVFHKNESAYTDIVDDLGEDGIGHVWTGEPGYVDSIYYFGLEKWSYEQVDNPELFQDLVRALDEKQERYMKLLCQSPDKDIINLGNLPGNFGPLEYEKYVIPFYQKYVPMLKEKGKHTSVHADAINLNQYKSIILKKGGIDIVEAFTPPPTGNLSLQDARKEWGKDVVIMVNFPEAVLLEGAAKVKDYTINLLKSDPFGRNAIGFTELGMYVSNTEIRRTFQESIRAVIGAIEDFRS